MVHCVKAILRVAAACMLAATFLYTSGCASAAKGPAQLPERVTIPEGLKMTLTGPQHIAHGSSWEEVYYDTFIENHGPRPIAIAVHPIWLRLELFTLDGEKVELTKYSEVDWADTAPEDFVILSPGERRKFKASCPSRPEPGTYKLQGVVKPTPTEIPAPLMRKMHEEDAAFLRSECRSAMVTVKIL